MVDVTAQPNEIDEVREVSLSSEYRGANDPVKQTDQVHLTIHVIILFVKLRSYIRNKNSIRTRTLNSSGDLQNH